MKEIVPAALTFSVEFLDYPLIMSYCDTEITEATVNCVTIYIWQKKPFISDVLNVREGLTKTWVSLGFRPNAKYGSMIHFVK